MNSLGRALAALFAAVVTSAALSSSALAAPGVPGNGKVSFAAFFGETDGSSQAAGISDDGNFVIYYSLATNIVAEDTNNRWDLYYYDRFWGLTTLISAAANGTVGNDESPPLGSAGRKISADGRYVLFQSSASNLVAGDTNAAPDVFVRDTVAGVTERISVAPGRTQINNRSFGIGMSADGRKCVFSTPADLVAGDTNGVEDIYLYDRTTHVTTLVSKRANGIAYGAYIGAISANGAYVTLGTGASLVAADNNNLRDIYRITLSNSAAYLITSNSAGVPSQGNSFGWIPISADGSRVLFHSEASDLVAGDTNGKGDVYMKNITTGQTVRVSLSATGQQSAQRCWNPDVSSNGRYVSMQCDGDDMVAGDSNGVYDIFVKDLQTGSVTLVSRLPNGAQGNSYSFGTFMTADGSKVAFSSVSTNLASPDTNAVGDAFVANRQ